MRRGELIGNLALQFGLPLVAIALACTISLLTTAPGNYIFIMLLLSAVGFFMLLKAKLSLIRQGRLFSFGPKGMSRTNRIFYVLGYVVMGVGLLLSLVFLGFYRGV